MIFSPRDIEKIPLNLADVNYIDSTGLAHLVGALVSVRKLNGEIKLLDLSNRIHDLLQKGRWIGNDLLQRRRGWADPISRRYTREDCLVRVWLREHRALFHLCRLFCRGVLASSRRLALA